MHGHVTYSEFSTDIVSQAVSVRIGGSNIMFTPCPFLFSSVTSATICQPVRSALCRIYDHSYMCAAYISYSALRL